MTVIKPTIGRVVLVFNRPGSLNHSQPEAALITYVHSDTLINVACFDANGTNISLTSLELEQEGGGAFANGVLHAEWMPYQKGQAAKTEQLQKDLDAATGIKTTGYVHSKVSP